MEGCARPLSPSPRELAPEEEKGKAMNAQTRG